MSLLNSPMLTEALEIQGPFLGTPDCWGNPCWQWIGSWGQLKESAHLWMKRASARTLGVPGTCETFTVKVLLGCSEEHFTQEVSNLGAFGCVLTIYQQLLCCYNGREAFCQ